MQRWKQAPSFETQRLPFPFVKKRATKGLMHRIAGTVVSPLILCHSLDSCPPPLVIKATQDSLSFVTLALEEPGESALELFAGAGVDHGVDAAVEVAQPEDHLEDRFGWFQCWEEGTWRGNGVISEVTFTTCMIQKECVDFYYPFRNLESVSR